MTAPSQSFTKMEPTSVMLEKIEVTDPPSVVCPSKVFTVECLVYPDNSDSYHVAANCVTVSHHKSHLLLTVLMMANMFISNKDEQKVKNPSEDTVRITGDEMARDDRCQSVDSTNQGRPIQSLKKANKPSYKYYSVVRGNTSDDSKCITTIGPTADPVKAHMLWDSSGGLLVVASMQQLQATTMEIPAQVYLRFISKINHVLLLSSCLM